MKGSSFIKEIFKRYSKNSIALKSNTLPRLNFEELWRRIWQASRHELPDIFHLKIYICKSGKIFQESRKYANFKYFLFR